MRPMLSEDIARHGPWNRRNQPYEFQALATYNAERARGIVHTPEWDAKMKLEQERFDAQQQEAAP